MPMAASLLSFKKEIKMGFWGLYFISLGSILGAGWMFAVLYAPAYYGVMSIFSWIAAGVFVLIIALVFSEVASALPQYGALVRYPHYAFGGVVGFLTGMAYYIAISLVPAIEAEAVVMVLSINYPNLVLLNTHLQLTSTGVLLALAVLLIIFIINYLGTYWFVKVNSVIVIVKIILVSLFILMLLYFSFNIRNFTSYGTTSSFPISDFFQPIIMGGLIFSFFGFEQAMQYGTEVKNPERNIFRAMIWSLTTALIVYVLLQIAFIGALNWSALGINSNQYLLSHNYAALWNSLLTFHYATNPFYFVVKSSNVPFIAIMLIVLQFFMLLSPFGTGMISNNSSFRSLYGLSLDQYFSGKLLIFSEKRGVPVLALIISTILSAVIILSSKMIVMIFQYVSTAMIILFLLSGPMLIIIRKYAKTMNRPIKLPFGNVFAPMAFVLSSLIILWLGFEVLNVIILLLLLFVPLFLIYYVPLNYGIKKSRIYLITFVYFIFVCLLIYFSQISENFLTFGEYYLALLMVSLLPLIYIGFIGNQKSRVEIKAGLGLLIFLFMMLLITAAEKYQYISVYLSYVLTIAGSLINFYLAVYTALEMDEMKMIRGVGIKKRKVY